jgi:hypothetical protein
MAEQTTKHLVKQEPFTYQWYLPSENADQRQIKLQKENAHGYIDGDSISAYPVSMEVAVEQETVTEEAAEARELPRETPHRIYRPKHRAFGKQASLGKLHFKGAMRTRILATAGWSATVSAGVAALLVRAGPFPGTQLAELGAVWAGIAAFLWFSISKLSK